MSGFLIDLFLVALAILFAVNGYRQGFFVGLMSFVGFFGGAAIGLQVGPALARLSTSQGIRVAISLGTIFGLAVLGQTFAGWLGARIRGAIRSPTARVVDDLGGSVVSVLALFLVAWLVAEPLASSSLPGLARAIRTSNVLHVVNKVMPPQARALSDALRSTVDTRGFPDVFGNLVPTQVIPVPAPNKALAGLPVVTRLHPSVVKIVGVAPSCSRRIEGSGFVFAPQHVLTNAHVVAGTRYLTVNADGSQYRARVVLYDPERDLAVIYVPGLAEPVLRLASQSPDTGSDAIVLGYPLDGPYDAEPARIRSTGMISGPDIYNARTVTREVTTLRGWVRSGNSGGPLINSSGTVVGVIFAAAADDPETGFALSVAEVAPVVAAGQSATAATGTGTCT